MYEPKYQLNQKDSARWHLLLTRHCLECPDKSGKVKRHRKYPPLTPEENMEFEQLDRKRSKKIEAHPKVKASIQRSKRLMRKADRLMADLEKLMLKLRVDRR
jgi:hypothetical protein